MHSYTPDTVFSRSEHLPRHLRYYFFRLFSSAHLAFHHSVPALLTPFQSPLERPARLLSLLNESCCSRYLQPSSVTRLSFIFISLPALIALLPRRDVGTHSLVRKQIKNGPTLYLEPCGSVQPCTFSTGSICISYCGSEIDTDLSILLDSETIFFPFTTNHRHFLLSICPDRPKRSLYSLFPLEGIPANAPSSAIARSSSLASTTSASMPKLYTQTSQILTRRC